MGPVGPSASTLTAPRRLNAAQGSSASPATPQVQAAFRNLAIAFIYYWRGHQVTAAREYCASHPATLLRQLGISPSRR
jgi:hypothetical protein